MGSTHSQRVDPPGPPVETDAPRCWTACTKYLPKRAFWKALGTPPQPTLCLVCLTGANNLYLPNLGDWSTGNTGAQKDQVKQKENASGAFQSETSVMISVAILKYLLQSQGFWSVLLTLNTICLMNPKWTSRRNGRIWGPWRKMWVRGSAVLVSLPVAPSSQHSGEDKETSHSLF